MADFSSSFWNWYIIIGTAVSILAMFPLLYLNRGWDPAWGGALRVFGARAECSQAENADPADEAFEDISPEGGTLVLLRSDRVPHEVMETLRPRHCIVGWLRSFREEPPS